MTTPQFQIPKIRKAINVTFDEGELSAFCSGYFPRVYNKFSSGMRKDRRITLLLDHCVRRRTGFETLLNAVRQECQLGNLQGSEANPLLESLEVYLKADVEPAKVALSPSGSKSADSRGETTVSNINTGGGFYSGGEAHITGNVLTKTVFNGPVSASFASSSRDRAKIAIEAVSQRELYTTNTLYIPPPAYEQAKKLLADKHVLILHGSAQHGKRTTALYLLSALHDQQCFEITPYLEWEQLDSSDLKQNAGYLIDTVPTNNANLIEFTLKRLSRIFGDVESHLIITVDSRVPLSNTSVKNYLIRWEQVPEQMPPTQMPRQEREQAVTAEKVSRHSTKLIDFGTAKEDVNISDVAGGDMAKVDIKVNSADGLESKQALGCQISKLQESVAALTDAPKGKREDASYALGKAKEACQEDNQERLVEKLESAQRIMLSIDNQVALNLADTIGTLLQGAMASPRYTLE